MSSASYEAWMQAQQSVLGSVLIDDRCASFLVFGLAEEDFCESYRSLYRAIRELYTTGKPVDPVAVLNVVGDSYMDFIIQLRHRNDKQSMIFSRIAINNGCTMVSP